MTNFTESEIEVFSLDELQKIGFAYVSGPSLAPDADATQPLFVHETAASHDEPQKRASYGDVILKHTLEQAINHLNPTVPVTARQEALKTVLAVYYLQLINANEAFHKMLTEGVQVTVQKDGQERGERVWLVDFQNPENNVFFAINQYTVEENNPGSRYPQ